MSRQDLLALAALALASGVAAQEPGTAPPEPASIHGEYQLRFDALLKKREPKAAGAVDRGLEWLALHQDADGRWDADDFAKHDPRDARCNGGGNPAHDVGVTGLALLAFLGDGHTTTTGKHQRSVARGVRWLTEQQTKTSGRFGTNAVHDFIYDHAIATLAMVEAYGLSRDPALRGPAQLGIVYLDAHRNPYGSWRYQPRDHDSDTSVTSWCLTAYESARRFGLTNDKQTIPIVLNYLDQVTDPRTGQAGYTKRGETSARHPGNHASRFPVEHGEAMTAAALSARLFAGQRAGDDPMLRAAGDAILAKPPRWEVTKGTVDLYYWYYATHALHHLGGRTWNQWKKKLQPVLLEHQRSDPSYAGSWDPIGAWGEDGGRVYATAMGVLCLEASYRFAADPASEVPDRAPFGVLRRLWGEARFGRAAGELKKLREQELAPDDRALVDRFEAALKRKVERAEGKARMQRNPFDYLRARDTLERIRKRFAGLSAGSVAAAELRHFRSDPKIKKEIRAAEKLARITKKLASARGKTRNRIAGQLTDLIEEYEGTRAAHEAKLILARM